MAFAGAAAVGLAAHAGAGCNEPPVTNFGNPNALDRKNLPGEAGAAPLDCTGDAAPGPFDGGCPSFATDVFPLMAAPGKWKCADSTCHGGASSPNIAGADPAAMLVSLKAISVGGLPYVPEGAADGGTAGLVCNLQGSCGERMPRPPGVDPLPGEICMIQAWIGCGAPP